MLEKYTIFDNFDKLDLNPIASLINPSKARTDRSVGWDLVSSATNKGSILYNRFNETNFSDLTNKVRPIAYYSDLKGAVPDFYNYIINNKFFIDITGDIQHGSIVSEQYALKSPTEMGIEALPVVQTLFYNNVFLDGFFYDVFLRNYEAAFSDAVMLYENPFYNPQDPKGETAAAYTDAIENYFIPTEDNFSNLNSFNPDTIDVNNNKVAFLPTQYILNQDGDSNLVLQFLSYYDALQYNQPPYFKILDYLYSEEPQVYRQMISLIQRLIYPYKTGNGAIPKHNYFVADLHKSSKQNPAVTIQPVYNFYSEKAEALPENVQLEWQLPNIYAYYSHFYVLPQDRPYYDNIIKLDSTESIVTDGLNVNKYYDITRKSKPYINFANSSDNEQYSKFYKLLRHQTNVFGTKVNEFTEDIPSIKNIFPFYNEIKLPALESVTMAEMDKVEGLLDAFMSFVSNYFSSIQNSSIHTFALHNKEIDNTQITMSDIQILNVVEDFAASDFFNPAAYFSVLESYNNKFAFDVTSPLNAEDVPLGSSAEMLNFEQRVKRIKNVLLQRANEGLLDAEAASKGEKCKSEILAFEIVKYAISETEGKTRLQSYFIPCIGEKSKTLIDTQIFADKEYIYEVFSISLVSGLQYDSILNTANIDNRFSQKDSFLINSSINALGSEPKVKGLSLLPVGKKQFGAASLGGIQYPKTLKPLLVRAPFFNNSSILNGEEQQSIVMVNKPPLPPEISFYPYKDVDDKILIMMNLVYGERKLSPIRVFPEDKEKISSYRKSQKHITGFTPTQLLYKTDDYKGTYKIYRTTTKPVNWGAFYDSSPVELNNVESSAFQDSLNANVDYYYFARLEDIKGNISNPTDIFYVRLVKEGGFPPYLIVKTYDFSEGRAPFVYEKGFKKYLKIRLADGTRKYFNSDNLSEMDFGYAKANSSRQLKKYKVRITSKSSGKKIDINIGFKKTLSDQYLADIDKTSTASDPSAPTSYTTDEGLFVDQKMIDEQNKKIQEKLKASAEDFGSGPISQAAPETTPQPDFNIGNQTPMGGASVEPPTPSSQISPPGGGSGGY